MEGSSFMSKKINSAKRIQKLAHAFICPLCGSPVKVVELKSLVCDQSHNFDFTKQGYLNLLTHAVKSHYSKELFQARQQIIMDAELYKPLHDELVAIIDQIPGHKVVADLGCGEGSHLQKIVENADEIEAIGIDIAKEGILMAAKNYDELIWLVGDLAKSPIGNGAVDVILNILSPSNYEEFKRMLAPEGVVVKVVPGERYLHELRAFLYEESEYSNEQTVSLFNRHFDLVQTKRVSYAKNLNQLDLANLVTMTPLAWKGKEEKIKQFMNQTSANITVDLELLIGRKKR